MSGINFTQKAIGRKFSQWPDMAFFYPQEHTGIQFLTEFETCHIFFAQQELLHKVIVLQPLPFKPIAAAAV